MFTYAYINISIYLFYVYIYHIEREVKRLKADFTKQQSEGCILRAQLGAFDPSPPNFHGSWPQLTLILFSRCVGSILEAGIPPKKCCYRLEVSWKPSNALMWKTLLQFRRRAAEEEEKWVRRGGRN